MGSFTAGAGTSYLLTSTQPVPTGTANGVLYLNGSKVVTSGSALTFDGTNLATTGGVFLNNAQYLYSKTSGGTNIRMLGINSGNTAYVGPIDSGPGDTLLNAASSSANIQFYASGTEQMRLTSTGLGIGTSSPQARLDLGSSVTTPKLLVYSSGNTRYGFGIAAGTLRYFVPTSSTSIHSFGQLSSVDGTTYTEQMQLNGDGNLGLGVTPSAWESGKPAVELKNGTSLWAFNAANGYFTQNSYYDGLGWRYISSNPSSYLQQALGAFQWHIAPSGTAGNLISFTQAMTLDTSGRLLIGAASSFSSAAKLQVQDNISLETNGTGGKLEFFSYGTARGRISTPATAGHLDVAATSILSFGTSSSERVRITSVGNVGIGTTNPSGKVQIGDTAGASGADFSALVLAGGAASPDSLMALTIEISDTGATGISGKNVLFSGSSSNSDFAFAPSQTLITTPSLILTSEGNVYIGGTADRATTKGKSALQIFNGTAPVGTLANGISIYSDAGEAYVMDAAGNATLFSPHDSETNEWIFRSKHTPTGKVLKIDVERLLRFVNDHFGLDAVREFVEA